MAIDTSADKLDRLAPGLIADVVDGVDDCVFKTASFDDFVDYGLQYQVTLSCSPDTNVLKQQKQAVAHGVLRACQAHGIKMATRSIAAVPK